MSPSEGIAWMEWCRRREVLYRNDRTNRAAFWHGGFLPPIPDCFVRTLGYLQKLRHFSLKLYPKLRTWKIHLDKSVTLSTKRRRRRGHGESCLRHLQDSRRVVAVYYTSLNCISISNTCIAVRKVATLLRELTCHMGSHSVTCHPAEVTFPHLPQPKLVLDQATPEGCKAELT